MREKVILLADSNEAHVDSVRRALESVPIPCRLDVVREGSEVLNYLFVPDWQTGARRELPDLILLELQLSTMGGLHVLQVLRRVRGQDHTRLPPVVVLTASNRDHDVGDAYRLGARSYVCKPADDATLTATVSEILRYWLALNEPIPAHHGSMDFLPEGL